MKAEALAHWNYAKEDLDLARRDLAVSPRAAASRAYYAAFHAVSALFALDGKIFSKHSALETAVHKELVKAGLWPQELGAGYSKLFKLRMSSDYDVMESITVEAAEAAMCTAKKIMEAVEKSCSQLTTKIGDQGCDTTKSKRLRVGD